MGKFLIAFFILVISYNANAQYDTSKYSVLRFGKDSVFFLKPTKADKYLENGEYVLAISEYKKIITKDKTDNHAVLNLAGAYAITNQKDSAFLYLNKAGAADSTGWKFNNPDFYNLLTDKRWKKFAKEVMWRKIESKSHQKFQYPDITMHFIEMDMKDQAYYKQIQVHENKYRNNPTKSDSLKIDSLWKLKNTLNKNNVLELEKIIKKYGWPKKSVFGAIGSGTAFQIIQHSDIKYQKKYLPKIKELCEINEADWQDFALMLDRILVSEKKPQIYGSQVNYNKLTKRYELFPIEDEKNVDERRIKVGLQPLKDYVEQWGIKYEYIK